MNIKVIIIALSTLTVILILCVMTYADEQQRILTDEKDRISYSIGHQIGNDFKKQGVSVDYNALLKGIKDAQNSLEPEIDSKEMKAILVDFRKRILASQRSERLQKKESYRGEGRDFLNANAQEKDVVVLPSGLQYKVIREGSGRRPEQNDRVTIHYRGTLVDGSEFVNTHRKGEPETVELNKLIPGMREALLLMKEGAEWKIFLPPDLAYGESGPLADRVVIFDLELLSVTPTP